MNQSLDKKKVVVITGAASGIGLSLALMYFSKGLQVCALDLNEEGLKLLPTKIHRFKVDVTKIDELHNLAKKIETEIGRPKIWINCAGIAKVGEFSDLSASDFEKTFAVNFFGVYYCMKAAMVVMPLEEEGMIVNMSSVSGMIPSPLLSSYSAAKHAVVGLTRSVQDELKAKNSKLNLLLVSPGFVKTPILNQGPRFQLPSQMDWAVANPDDVAYSIFEAIENGDEEIVPTITGKILEKTFKHVPDIFRFSGRALISKFLKTSSKKKAS